MSKNQPYIQTRSGRTIPLTREEARKMEDRRRRRGLFDMRRDLGRAPTMQEWMDERR